MARKLLKTQIVTGNTVEAFHVSQSVDAFSADSQAAYDISVSGSFTVTGSTVLSGSTALVGISGNDSSNDGNVLVLDPSTNTIYTTGSYGGAANTGPQGPAGAGSQGPAGTGTQGPAGAGSQGPSGTLGPQGPIGTGTQGPAGAGSQGPSGTLGPQGPTGNSITGPTGVQGPTGIGSQGPAGAGSQGPAGAGSQGPAGTGTQGPVGSQGPEGAGSQGPAGAGSQGPEGNLGPQGPTGTSITGPTGNLGPQGPAGTAQGPAGSQGPEGGGTQGPAGSQGPEGNLGPQGPTGAGTQGPAGTGTQGPVGTGTQGPSGTGTQGPSGTGTQGPTGPTGNLGPQGPEGSGGGGSSTNDVWNTQIEYVMITSSYYRIAAKSTGNVLYKNWNRDNTTLYFTSSAHNLQTGDMVVVRNTNMDYIYRRVTKETGDIFSLTVDNSGDTSGTNGAYITAYSASLVDTGTPGDIASITIGTVGTSAFSGSNILNSLSIYSSAQVNGSAAGSDINIILPSTDTDHTSKNTARHTYEFPCIYGAVGSTTIGNGNFNIQYPNNSNFREMGIFSTNLGFGAAKMYLKLVF